MELAQHLVNEGLVRYQDGRFSLPDELDEKELPKTLASSLQAWSMPCPRMRASYAKCCV